MRAREIVRRTWRMHIASHSLSLNASELYECLCSSGDGVRELGSTVMIKIFVRSSKRIYSEPILSLIHFGQSAAVQSRSTDKGPPQRIHDDHRLGRTQGERRLSRGKGRVAGVLYRDVQDSHIIWFARSFRITRIGNILSSLFSPEDVREVVCAIYIHRHMRSLPTD